MSVEKQPYNRALRELRKSTAVLTDDGRFADVSGVHPQTIKNVMTTDALPEVLTIKKWVEGCGTTLSLFFASLESQSDESVDVAVRKEHLRFHEHLRELLDGGEPWITTLEVNLDALYVSYQSEKKEAKKR